MTAGPAECLARVCRLSDGGLQRGVLREACFLTQQIRFSTEVYRRVAVVVVVDVELNVFGCRVDVLGTN